MRTHVSLSGGTIPAGGNCNIKVNVTAPLSASSASYTNTIPASALTTTQGATNASSATAPIAVTSVSVSKVFAPPTITAGGTSLLTITLTNPTSSPYTVNTLTDSGLPSPLTYVNDANLGTTCGGTPTITAPQTVTLTGGTIPANSFCTLQVDVNAPITATGTYTNTIPAGNLTTTQGASNTNTVSVGVTVNSGVTVSKTFTPNTIPNDGATKSLLTITLLNNSSTALTNATITDTLPSANLTAVNDANLATTCTSGTQTVTLPSAQSVKLTGGSIPASSSCTITVDVTGLGATATYQNNIAANALTTTQNVKSTSTGNVPITVNASSPPTVTKAFAPTTIALGNTTTIANGTGDTRLRITIVAPSDTALTSFSITDNLPAGMTVTNINTAGTSTPAAKNAACQNGTLTAATNSSAISWTGGTIAASASCQITVYVTSSTAGTVTNIIHPGDISSTPNRPIAANATANLTTTSLSVSKAFYPTTVVPNSISTLTITLSNDSLSPLTTVSLTDNTGWGTAANGFIIASPPAASTNCNVSSTPVITAVAGAQSISMTGGSMNAGTAGVPWICTIQVNVQGKGIPASYTNTISTANVSAKTPDNTTINSTQNATGTLTIANLSIEVVKGFNPLTVFGGSSSTLSVQLTNPNSGELDGISFIDNMPAGMTIANPPNLSAGTCNVAPTGTAGSGSFSFSGGILAGNATCTMTLSATMNVNGNLTNTIYGADVSTTNGATTTQNASASLTNLPGASISKFFTPNSIAAGSSSTLTITIQNTGNTPLTGMGLIDNLPGTLPSGLIIASSPAPATTCNATSTPTLTATAGTQQIQLANGSLAGTSTCTITVGVTSTIAGSYQNCIPVGALTNDQSTSNTEKACDTLTVTNSSALGDFVWDDTNHNGIQDAGEPGIAGVTVTLYGSNGTTVLGTTTTAADGSYHFTGLAAGTYYVGFSTPSGYTFTTQYAPGSTTANDSNANTTTNVTTGTNMSDAVTLTAGETDNTIDAGLYQPAALGDFVWNDANHNGIQDAGEPGIAGVTVTLYGSNGTTVLGTTTTAADGSYHFTGLAAGTYYVGFSTPSGYVFSPQYAGSDTSKDSNANVTTNVTTGTNMSDVVTLTAGQTDNTIDAGLYQPAALGDFVWNDTNHNGIQDAGETGISGVTVTLYGSNGTTVLGTTTTAADGSYHFTGLAAGTYYVGFSTPSGYIFSPQYAGSDTSKDSNANVTTNVTTGTNMSDVVTLTAGQTDNTIDAGLYQPAALGDFVWNDTNHNGIQDAGETGISGVTVTLYGSNGTTVLGTTTTAADGSYHFTGLAAGTYYVGFSTPSGYIFSPQYAGSDTSKDSNANVTTNVTTGTNMSDVVTLTAGQTDNTIDAGLYQPAALGDFVWNDTNHNGIQDAGETGISGVTVTLYGSNGTTVLGTTTTAADGSYHFTGLAAGTYYVGFSTPSGYIFSPQYAGSDTSKDSNANVTTNVTTGTNMSDVVTLTAGQTDNTIDAGLYQPAALGDFVWNDTNHNGIQDAGETGISGVTVTLYGSNGTTVLGSTTTAADGSYHFTGLAAGTYYVGFSTPSGYIFSPQYAGSDTSKDSNANVTTNVTTGTNMSDVVTLTAGQTDNTIDAGLYQPAALGDFVWNDTNHNGIQDAGETGISGVTVTLYGSNGTTVLGTTTTAADGSYHFTGLAAGTYYVGFSTPSGYVFSPQYAGSDTSKDSNANVTTNVTTGTNMSDVVTLTAGQTDNTIDAGLYQPAALGDFVWNDTNHNGIQDAGETGISGVTVTLYGSNGTTVLGTTTTAADGSYHFTGLAAGTYYVGFSTPSGYIFSPQYAGSDTSKDSNANVTTNVTTGTNMSDVVTLTAGQTDNTIDAGLSLSASLASLGDYVWDDANVNGIQDSSEKGIAGVTVNLLLGPTGTTVLKTTTTDANGSYHFTNLVPGTYRVQFIKPAGYSFSPQYAPGSTMSNDSNANVSTGITDTITLTAGQTDNTIDAGLWQPAANLFDPPIGIKVLSATGLPELEWQMTWINNANVAAINVQITDPIPAGTTYVATPLPNGSVSCVANGLSTTTACTYDPVKGILWQGSIASDLGVTDPKIAKNSVVITFSVTVLNGVNNVNNQASSITDTTGNGTFLATTTSVSDSNIASWSRNGNGGGGGNGNKNGVNPAAQLPSTGFAPGVTTSLAPEPANIYDASSDLTIEIPSLGIKTAIVGVPQSGDTWDISWLGDQVGYLNGTAYPTWSGNSVLTGHVYESNGLPGPFINLSTLKWGDQIIVHFAGQQYIYEVQENNIVSPTDRSAFKHEDQPWLTLVTCKDYNASANTYKYRVVVGAVLIKTESEPSSNPSRK